MKWKHNECLAQTHTHKHQSEIPNGGKKARKPFLSTRCVYLRSGNLCNKISVLILKVERSASRNRQTETSKRSKRTLLVLKIRHWRYYCRFILGSRFTFFFHFGFHLSNELHCTGAIVYKVNLIVGFDVNGHLTRHPLKNFKICFDASNQHIKLSVLAFFLSQCYQPH